MKEKADENYKDMLLFRLTLEANLALPSDNYKAIRLAEAAFKMSLPNPPPRVQQALSASAFSMYERPFYCSNMKHSDQVNSAVFSSKNKQILTCSDDNTARLWDLKGSKLGEFRHRGAVYSAIFSLDGKQILTASRDGTAKLWDLSGNLLADFNKHKDTVTSALFSPDGKKILTASVDGNAILWYTPNAIIEWLETSGIPRLSSEERNELGIELDR